MTCSSATTLTQLATCIAGQMPGSGSNGCVAPSAQEQADWRGVVTRMMGGEISHQAPHALYDIGTEVQAIEMFGGTNAPAMS